MNRTTIDTETTESIRELRQRIQTADGDTLDLLFRQARTFSHWQDKPVSDETLRALYDIAKMGPTSMNNQPMRLVFVKSPAAKAKLIETAMEGNRPKIEAAPITAIIAHDLAFYQHLDTHFPMHGGMDELLANKPSFAEKTAIQNGTLQGAYLIIAARALGLDCGPMAGFDNTAVDKAFFADTTLRSNFIMNLGYGDETQVYPRLPRMDFDEMAKIV